MFVRELFRPLAPELQYKVISMICQLVLGVFDGVLEIQAERDHDNNAFDDIPPTRPHELVKMRGREFGIILSAHIDRLRQFWTEELIINIEHQHSKLVLAYQNDSALKSALDKCDHDTSFEAAWVIVEGRFDTLRDFCGGIATVFVNTA